MSIQDSQNILEEKTLIKIILYIDEIRRLLEILAFERLNLFNQIGDKCSDQWSYLNKLNNYEKDRLLLILEEKLYELDSFESLKLNKFDSSFLALLKEYQINKVEYAADLKGTYEETRKIRITSPLDEPVYDEFLIKDLCS